MSDRWWPRPRLARLVVLVAAAAAFGLPASTHAAPTLQVDLPTEEERWRAAEEAAQQAAQALRAWPSAYGYFRPRPPFPGGPLDRPYPWELLGSPFVPVSPVGEIQFLGIQPLPYDPCLPAYRRMFREALCYAGVGPAPQDIEYPRLDQHYLTPLAFRLNFLEAEPYLNAGYAPAVLEAWARYLGRSPAELARPPRTPQEVTRVIADWLRDAGYLVDLAPPGRRLY